RRDFDAPTLLAFLQENDFRALIGRIEQVADAAETARVEAARVHGGDAPDYRVITDIAELETLLAAAGARGQLAIDTETTSLNVARAELVGISLAIAADSAVYLPLGHVDDFGQQQPGQL